MTIFNEQSLYNGICEMWGEAGAHAEVFRELCKRSGIEIVSPLIEETVEEKIKRIYVEEGGSKMGTIKRIRWELDEGRLDLKAAKALVEKYVP